MSVLAQDAPRIDAPTRSETDNRRALSAAVLGVGIVALSVYLCVGVSWWFLPLSVLLIGGVPRSFRQLRGDVRTRQPRIDGNPGFAEVPMLAYAGRR